jgi:hypothetical protein
VAQSGDVIFRGNCHEGGQANGMHFCNQGDGHALAIGAAEGLTFANYDPISGNSSDCSDFFPNFTVQINPEVWQTGTVLFDRYRSDIWFESTADSPGGGATVSYGTVVLQNGASFGAGSDNFLGKDPNSGTFTLGESATLRIVSSEQDIGYHALNGYTPAEMQGAKAALDPAPWSEIGAGATNLLGHLQFVMPSNFINNRPLLKIPQGTVAVPDSTTIGVGVSDSGGETFALAVGESITLLDCLSLTCDRETFPDCDGSSIPNVLPGYKFHVWREANRILAGLLGVPDESSSNGSALASSSGTSSGASSSTFDGSGSSGGSAPDFDGSGAGFLPGAIADPRYKALSEGWLAGMALLNDCGDLWKIPQTKKTVAFCDLNSGRKRYKTGSSIELRDTSLVSGLARAVGPLTCGAFFEGAFANVRTENELDDGTEIFGEGRARVRGGGAFCVIESNRSDPCGARLEMLLRAGSLRNRWNGKDSAADMAFSGTVPYVGARVGLSYRWENFEKYSVELYGKYQCAYLMGKKFPADEISFRSFDSQRFRLGGRLTYPTDWKLFPWFGAYYERELAGTAEGTVEGLEIPRPTLKGGRTAGEVGLSWRPISGVSVDLAVRGSTGLEKGIGAYVRGGYEF